MKKAKILVPAMGMMLLSTAAAVSGTMAWFTASRSVTVHTTDFAVESLDGALTAKCFNLSGTNADGTSATVGLGNNKLCDASFNHANGELFTDKVDANDQPDGFSLVGDLDDLTGSNATAWSVNNTTTYYAAAFKITFSYEFKGDTTTRHIFFDAAESDSEAAKQGGVAYTNSDHWRTGRGFRIAMIGGGNELIWAPQRGASDTFYVDGENDTAVSYTYVNGTQQANIGSYSKTKDANDQNLICSQTTDNIPTDHYAADNPNNDNVHTGRYDYLGTLTKPDTADANGKYIGTCDVKVVAWFEGTDPEVINDATMDQVSTTMQFYVRTAHVGA